MSDANYTDGRVAVLTEFDRKATIVPYELKSF